MGETLLTALPVELAVQRRVVVRDTIVVRPGHPVRRSSNRMVFLRPPRRLIVVLAPIVFLPPVVWGFRAIRLPDRDLLVWGDTESVRRNDGWVDLNIAVDNRGEALYLKMDGQAQIDFAEVTFNNGQEQVVDFHERVQDSGTFELLDLKDGRKVETVRLLAKAVTRDARLTVYTRK